MRCLKKLILRSSAVTVTYLCVLASHSSCEILKCLFSTRDISRIKHDLLHPNELPRAGMLVAIDAEFVSMQQEETELRSDGTKKVIRPARLSLARVSVLRGDGPKAGVPFIDDHIHTSEMIVDYLTEWSGIKCRYGFGRSVKLTQSLRLLGSRWRPRPTFIPAYSHPSEDCLQEASHSRGSRLHIHRAWTLEGLPHY